MFVGFKDWVTLGLALSGATFLLLAVVGAFVSYKKLSRTKEGIYIYIYHIKQHD